MLTEFIRNLLIKLFGANYETSIGGVMTAIGAVPAAIQVLGLATLPEWLRVAGLVCAFISFIYMSVKSKSKTVTGVEGISGENGATRKEELK